MIRSILSQALVWCAGFNRETREFAFSDFQRIMLQFMVFGAQSGILCIFSDSFVTDFLMLVEIQKKYAVFNLSFFRASDG